MKILSTFALATVVFAGFASAAITPTLATTPTVSGSNFLWSYQISVDDAEQLVSGNFSTCQGGVPCGTFFTIYDFSGYVMGSINSGPSGWTGSAQLTGITASNQLPGDNANVTNLTWTYVGPPAAVPGPISNLGGFSALSAFSAQNLNGTFTYQAQKIANTSAPDAGIGPISIPLATSGVPEPTSMALIGSGLIGLAVLRRKYSRS